MIESGVTKNGKIRQLKDGNFYPFNNMKDNFQGQLLEKVMDNDNKKDENVEKVLLFTT